MGCSITAVLESQWIWFTLWKNWPKVYREAIYEAGLISTISLHWCLIKVTGGFISWKMSFGISASGSVFVAPTFARLFSGIEREEKKSLIFWKFEFQLVFVSIKEKKLFLLFSSLETFSWNFFSPLQTFLSLQDPLKLVLFHQQAFLKRDRH